MSEPIGLSPRRGLSMLTAAAITASTLGLSAYVGRRNAPDRSHPSIRTWYSRLDKPDFTPPPAVFAAVWPVLETSVAFGGYRLLRHPPSARRNVSLGLWFVTTAMIGAWTQLFFRERKLGGSALASAAMLATATVYAAKTRKLDRVAQATAIPLVGGLAFATILAADTWRRNRSGGPHRRGPTLPRG